MTYRSKAHTDLLHDAPCFFSFPHRCNGPSVPCHSNNSLFGRGKDFRTPDWAVAAGCPAAHYEIDEGTTLGREQSWTEWLLAFKRTMDWLFENELLVVKGKR